MNILEGAACESDECRGVRVVEANKVKTLELTRLRLSCNAIQFLSGGELWH